MFKNRTEAGKKLASELIRYKAEHPIILALPRGGVPIGFEIARVLKAPLEVIVARKIGLLANPEFGIGAVAEGGIKVLDQATLAALGINMGEVEDFSLAEIELKRRVAVYRGGRPLTSLTGKTVILVDDGLATGVTAQAAIEAVKRLNPKKIIFATPLCAQDLVEEFKTKSVQLFYLYSPPEFRAVGLWYKNFPQLSDEEIVNLLKKSKKWTATRP